MALPIVVEQVNAFGSFTLGYVLEDGIYREKQTPYISERQREILEARAAEEKQRTHTRRRGPQVERLSQQIPMEPEPYLEMERRLS